MICENSCLTDNKKHMTIDLLSHENIGYTQKPIHTSCGKITRTKLRHFIEENTKKWWKLEAYRSNKENTDYLRYMDKCMIFDKNMIFMRKKYASVK